MSDLVIEEIRWQARLCRVPNLFARARAEYTAAWGSAMLAADESVNQAVVLHHFEGPFQ